jgi:hypothetical protein
MARFEITRPKIFSSYARLVIIVVTIRAFVDRLSQRQHPKSGAEPRNLTTTNENYRCELSDNSLIKKSSCGHIPDDGPAMIRLPPGKLDFEN